MEQHLKFTDRQIQEARSIDLLTYLQYYEPNNLVHIKGDVYCTAEHDSLKISRGMWYWWSKGFGGKNAIDYLIKVKDMTFANAVGLLLGEKSMEMMSTSEVHRKNNISHDRQLFLPERNENCNRVREYLHNRRGIDYRLIDLCISNQTLYEDKRYHNCVFVGMDENSQPRYAMVRGTLDRKFAQDCGGSDKRYSFRICNHESDVLQVFEAAIDVLSNATMQKMWGLKYNEYNMLSLGGVYAGSDKTVEIPVALKAFLERRPDIKHIELCLDADEVGQAAAKKIKDILEKKYADMEYKVTIAPPISGKDYNDMLLNIVTESNKNFPQR